MRIGVCGSSADRTVATSAAAFVEENVQGFFIPTEDDAAFARKRAAAGPLPIPSANCFLPGALPVFGPAHDRTRTLAWAATTFARAKAVGAALIVFGSGAARKRPDDLPEERARQRFAALAAEVADLAAPHAITVAIEPLQRAECNFINTLDDGADIVRRADRPNLGIVADLYHMRREGEGPQAIARNGAVIRHVHIAEVETRSAPGVKGDDFRPWFAELRAIGYDGAIALECSWSDAAKELPRAIEVVRRQLAEVGISVAAAAKG